MERVTAFVDGFNLYHAIVDLHKRYQLQSNHMKWLDIRSLVQSSLNRNQTLEEVYLFTALREDWEDGEEYQKKKLKRHKKYLEVVRDSGVHVIEGNFKKKEVSAFCPGRDEHMRYTTYEEKETDVNIALYMLQLAHEEAYDRAILISVDSDLVPAVRMIKEAKPNISFTFMPPPHRGLGETYKAEMRSNKDNRRKMAVKHLEANLFPKDVILEGGRVVTRPNSYKPAYEDSPFSQLRGVV